MRWRELQLRILAGRKIECFCGLENQPLDVVSGVFHGHHRGLDDACRVHDHFVGFGDLYRTGLRHEGLAGQDVGVLCRQWLLYFAP